MKQAHHYHDHISNIGDILTQQNENSSRNDEMRQKISQLMQYRQDKIFYIFTNDKESYFANIWERFDFHNFDFREVVLQKMGQREEKVTQQLENEAISIQKRMPKAHNQLSAQNDGHNEQKLNLLKLQSDHLRNKINEFNTNIQSDTQINMRNPFAYLYSEQKIKETQEAIKQYREARLQRKKVIQQQKKREEQEKRLKEQQQRQAKENLLNERKEELKKIFEKLQEKRQKQKQLRERRNSQYIKVKKQTEQKRPLYHRMYEGYSKRYEQEFYEKHSRMQSERKIHNESINGEILDKHSKQYQYLRQKKEQERQYRLSLNQMEEKARKSRIKLNSSYQMQKYEDEREIQREIAREKIQKMKQYKSLVKEKFMPKIDEEKRKQLMNMIEQMELRKKHVKKTVLDNGSVMYEQLKPADPYLIGLNYLQSVKQMAAKSRTRRKSDKEVSDIEMNSTKKRPANYLEELRKNRPHRQKLSFIDRNSISYDEKMNMVVRQSEKLIQLAKQNEMMLKFGKFKTSQQILNCKQEIDNNYLDLVNMKLKFILNQQSQSQKAQSQR